MTPVADNATLGTPYWWEHGAALPSFSSELPSKTQLLIVGAGYTGLSAAIAAHDAGAKVVVVDAGIPGLGASTRNGGMFGPHPRLGFDTLAAKFGQEAANGIYNESQSAFDFTSNLIKKENIDCHFEQCGRIQLAWTKAHLLSQRRQVEKIKQVSNINVEIVEQAELDTEINSPCYFGGIRFPDHASLHPRQFHDGLIRAVVERGIDVIQKCAIQTVERIKSEHQKKQFLATTKSGEKMYCEKVVMATNGYTQGKFSWFASRVFPLPSYLIATEPLSSNLIESLAPGRRMMVETRARHSYFRISPDGTRILFGGRASMTPINAQRAAKRLHQTLCEVWPELSSTRVTHSWMGNTGYSFNHVPQIGTHQGINYSMGYSGSGVVLAPYLGAKAAWMVLGDERGISAYQQSEFASKWFFRGGKPRFLHPANAWYRQVVDRMETNRAKRDQRS